MNPTAAPVSRFATLTREEPGFAEACGMIAALYATREAEFGYNAEIDGPVIQTAEFLADPRKVLSPVIAGVNPITILTTWSDTLGPILRDRGFRFSPVDWPAGPRHCGVFRRSGHGRETYIELVNEEAPEIAPSHVVIAHDANGFVGGSIAVVRNDAAWLAVMCVRAGMPAGAGSRLWDALAADLAERGVARLDLGTQTAEGFYRRCGMTVTNRVLPRLRWRHGAEGRVWNDLVMMTIGLQDTAPGQFDWERG